MIYIFTGPIRTGKTSLLFNWLKANKKVGGFLTPDKDQLRILLDLENKVEYPFQIVDFKDEALISIGRFHFLQSSFDDATKRTLQQSKNEDINMIVIDEVGKLELRGLGFDLLVRKLLEQRWSDRDLLLVVRDTLLDQVIEKYNFDSFTQISRDDFPLKLNKQS